MVPPKLLGPRETPGSPRLTVVVPTLNEAHNLRHLVRRLDRSLRGIPFEIVIVDDASTDGTGELADALAEERSSIVVIQRTAAERGLSAAILAGFRAARGQLVAVIDADLQHDPGVLPRLVENLARVDIAIGSRYAFRGKTCGWSILRELESRAAAWLTRRALGLSVRDPLSGCFALRRRVIAEIEPVLQPRGWKLLLDILAAGRELSVAEVPMTFRARCRGQTKMNGRVVAAWLQQLRELRRAAPAEWLTPAGARP
jgi:dolichol-phosphate mannosyltransferase